MLCIAYKSIFEILIKQRGETQYLMINVVYCIQKYLWNPDKTTLDAPIFQSVKLCIAYKSIFEILIKQQHISRDKSLYVVYCIQKYLWNPDKTTVDAKTMKSYELCIAYKSIFEILIKQRSMRIVLRRVVVYCIQKYLWNPDKTTKWQQFVEILSCVLHTKVSLKSW